MELLFDVNPSPQVYIIGLISYCSYDIKIDIRNYTKPGILEPRSGWINAHT